MKEKEIKAFLGERGITLFDSALGTALFAAGYPAGLGTEKANLTHREAVLDIHLKNINAGSDVITSNSFGVTQMYMRGERESALKLLTEAVKITKQAISEEILEEGEVLSCLGIGPAGLMFGSYGDVSYDEAELAYAAQAEAGASAGADFILLETFSDLEEITRAAEAAGKASGLPVFGTMTFDEGGRTFMGTSPAEFVRKARFSGFFAIGANCSLGPMEMIPVISEILDAAAGIPVLVQPNAGQPVYKNGQTFYEITTEDFSYGVKKLIDLGISAIGGCCGTTPEMISAVRGIIDSRRNEDE
jgi:5-methyltetrahydrofolate--homocysteine methyltransferase